MAGLAHELRNPLAAMCQAVTQLRANPALGDGDHRLLDAVLEELARMRRMTTGLLAVATPPAARFAPASVEALVDATVTVLRLDPRVESRIEIVVDVADELPLVRLDADGIRQVLWNLLLNAVQALPQGGRVHVSAMPLRDRARDGVCLEVCDDGPGIPPKLRERVFRLFETLRESGSGLGLALARNSIGHHGGWIRIADAPGGGACVRLWLPIAGPGRSRRAAGGG